MMRPMILKLRTKFFIFLCGGFLAPIAIGLLIFSLRPTEPPKQYLTLSEINAHAQSLPESPRADDHDWEDPTFISFHKSRTPNWFDAFLRHLKLSKPEPYEPPFLVSLIKEITASNIKRGLSDGKQSFVHIKAQAPTDIIIFGDVHGALHSFVRDLNNLKKKGVIDENLKILNANTYIVANGDFINRAPYSIDCLIVLCLLMKNNPDQVFYVAGNHERDGTWLDYGLRRELIVRASYDSVQTPPFLEQFLDFFSTLPEAIYVSGQNDTESVIRISFGRQDQLAYNERKLANTFLKQKEPVKIYPYTTTTERSSRVDVRASIRTEDWRRVNRTIHGLGLLDQDQGATSWSVLSSPILVHRTFLQFYDDAYATISINQAVESASITLSHADTRTHEAFIHEKQRNIISAREASLKVSHAEVLVGSSMSLIRGQPSIGRQLKSGIDTRINEYNRSKDENEANIRLDIDNDDYVPKNARKNIIDHIANGIRFFLIPAGTPTVLSYLDLVEESNSVLFFPFTGADSIRDPRYKQLIHFRATDIDEVHALVKTLMGRALASKVMIFYQDDSYGRPPFLAAVEELKKFGITKVEGLPYTRGSISFREQAAKILHDPPDALGFFSTSTAAKELIRQIGVADLSYTTLFGLSSLGEAPIRQFLNRKGLNVLLGSSVPNPRTSMLPIAKNFRKAMQINHNYIDPFAFEGYIAASIFVEALAASKEAVPSPQEILKHIEQIKNRNFHGIPLNFDPKKRSLATRVWVETGDEVEWKEFPIQ